MVGGKPAAERGAKVFAKNKFHLLIQKIYIYIIS